MTQRIFNLGVRPSHGRPRVSDDNPYSEAQFKTLKYHPTFPERFGSVQDARVFCRGFFDWYNTEHRHDGLGLLTPEVVHSGRTEAVLERRRAILAAAYAAHPERFPRKPPEPPAPPRRCGSTARGQRSWRCHTKCGASVSQSH